jgi:hypothetical protein
MRLKHFFLWNAEGGEGGGSGGDSIIPDAPASVSEGTPPPEQPSFVSADGSFSEGWTSRLPDDLKDAGASLTKFKTVKDLAKSYHNLEKTIGARPQGVVIPTEKSTPEEVAAYRKAVGVPDTVEAYDFKPEEMPEGMTWNPDNAKAFAAVAHKHNIPPAAMKELAGIQAKMREMEASTLANMVHAKREEGKAALQKEWGTDFDKNIGRAQVAAKLAGIDSNSPGFGDPNVVKAFVRLTNMLSEDKLVAANNSSGSGAGGARARDIQTNPSNPLYAKYQEGDPETVSLVRGLMVRG